jgi:hypothetical protein
MQPIGDIEIPNRGYLLNYVPEVRPRYLNANERARRAYVLQQSDLNKQRHARMRAQKREEKRQGQLSKRMAEQILNDEEPDISFEMFDELFGGDENYAMEPQEESKTGEINPEYLAVNPHLAVEDQENPIDLIMNGDLDGFDFNGDGYSEEDIPMVFVAQNEEGEIEIVTRPQDRESQPYFFTFTRRKKTTLLIEKGDDHRPTPLLTDVNDPDNQENANDMEQLQIVALPIPDVADIPDAASEDDTAFMLSAALGEPEAKRIKQRVMARNGKPKYMFNDEYEKFKFTKGMDKRSSRYDPYYDRTRWIKCGPKAWVYLSDRRYELFKQQMIQQAEKQKEMERRHFGPKGTSNKSSASDIRAKGRKLKRQNRGHDHYIDADAGDIFKPRAKGSKSMPSRGKNTRAESVNINLKKS